MPDAQYFKVDRLEDYVWPITYRYHLSLPWGATTQQWTVDAPELQGDIESSMELGRVLWERGMATAMTTAVDMHTHDTVCWRFAPGGLPTANLATRGRLAGTPTPRELSAVVCFRTDHTDDLGHRQLYLPGIPSAWVSGKMLTLGARDAIECWSAVIIMGMLRHLVGSPLQLLLHYPQLLVPTAENPSGVAFRKVERIRGCVYTGRAPLPSALPWP